MNKYIAVFLVSTLFSLCDQAFGNACYVSPSGSDLNPGTLDKPFRSIKKAAAELKPGDICYIREGIYRETIDFATSGKEGKPIVFESYHDETVILDGTELIDTKWKKHSGNIYKTSTNIDFIQLFVENEMMIEARYPNANFRQIFDRTRWLKSGYGSGHGKLVSEEIAATGIDWTGAMACLNVAHQWWTWHRKIEKHSKGTDSLFYAADLVGLCNYDPDYNKDRDLLLKKWGDDYFYLFGKLEALDVETEWYRDPESGLLYLYAPSGQDPNNLTVRYKSRNYAFHLTDVDYVEIRGINFFANTFLLEDCNHCLVEDCEMLFPTFTRTITEYDQERKESVITRITGDHNTVSRVSIAYVNNLGIMTMGNYNTVTNCIIHDVNWVGTLIYPALQLSASPDLGVNWFNTIQYPPTERTPENSEVTSYGNVASHNTLYNSGNTLLVYHAAESLVEYNHIYDGGMSCKDVSLVYGCWPFTKGSIIRYNWVHGCKTDHFDGRSAGGGKGIRADDQSRNNIIHHNVVWDCGMAGILVKGEDNKVYNNTVFDIQADGKDRMHVCIMKEPEPIKEWAVRWPQLQIQNQWTEVKNNLTVNITSKHDPDADLPESDRVSNNFLNFTTENIPLMDVKNFDFRPKKGSPLIDAGEIIHGINNPFMGEGPDIGAYEFGEAPWIPGADWKEDYMWSKKLFPVK